MNQEENYKNLLHALEEKNRQLEKREQTLLEAQRISHIGNWKLDFTNNKLTCSKEVYRIFDLDFHEFEANDEIFLSRVHPDDSERVGRVYKEEVEKKQPYSIAYRILTQKGVLKYVEEKCRHIRDEHHNVVRSIGTVQDITTRRVAEIKLKKSQENYQSILENMQDTYYRTDIDGNILMLSGEAEKLLGYHKNELIGTPLANLYRYPSLRDCFLQGLMQNNGKYSTKIELLCKNQNVIWVSSKSQFWYKESGEIGGVEGFARDITQEQLAQIKEKKLLDLIDASSNEIYVFNKETFLITYVNQGGLNNIQYTMKELFNKYIYEINTEFDTLSFKDYIQPLIDRSTDKLSFETRHQRKDGTTYPVQVHLQLLKTQESEEFLAVVIDITEQVKINQQIKTQEEMILVQSRHAAMGEMISMIAHQWRQPLSIVGMLTNLCLLHLKSDSLDKESMEEELQTINGQVQHMSKTIEDFKNFFQESNSIEEIYLYQILMKTENILGAVLQRSHIQLTLNCDESIHLYTYGRELIQVIINIVSNAKDALEKISDEKNIVINVVEQNEQINISIFNNGFPIEESIKQKIFEPYFTTKADLGGTGLGLYMVKTILDKHLHGTINLYNHNDGVEFIITLPKILKLTKKTLHD
jgi:PAS domain S-box-containing protein